VLTKTKTTGETKMKKLTEKEVDDIIEMFKSLTEEEKCEALEQWLGDKNFLEVGVENGVEVVL